jgi:hypothetical protein
VVLGAQGHRSGDQLAMSQLEEVFALQLRAIGAPTPTREYRFAEPRKYRFDFCWPDQLLAVEIHGGVWVRGRHVRPAGMASDAEKTRLALDLGWRCYPFLGSEVESGVAVEWLERVLREAEAR